MFFSVDYNTLGRLRESGRYSGPVPRILDFDKMLTGTDLTRVFRKIFGALESAYEYPVDIEFTVNFSPDGDFRFNLLQCRPLQTKVEIVKKSISEKRHQIKESVNIVKGAYLPVEIFSVSAPEKIQPLAP